MLNLRGLVMGLVAIASSAFSAEPVLVKRLNYVSSYFLGQPYIVGPLGEGPNGEFNQSPLYRFDGFDCVTYVETVLALSISSRFSDFENKLQAIRYLDGKIDFTKRNHFTSIDWNVNNERKGFVRDMTLKILGENQQPIAVEATAIIDKPNWYRHFTSKDIVHSGSSREKEMLANRLRDHSRNEHPVTSIIHYIPLTALFDKNGKIHESIQNQIPDVAIIEIVRPNWDLTKEIGTHLHISHMGFAIKTPQRIVFRNASSLLGKVADIPLDQYLLDASQNPSVKGIKVLAVL